MTELVTVGGVCFVAVEPEKVNANPIGPIRPIGPIGKSAETGAETREAGNGKRKYRPRGERSRKEQQRAAARSYRLRHLEYYRQYQKEYRMKHQKGKGKMEK